MEIAPYINASLTPAAAPAGVDAEEYLENGLYAYINADREPELQRVADSTFGRTARFTNSEEDATLIGRCLVSNLGYSADPRGYIQEKGLFLFPDAGATHVEMYEMIGRDFIKRAQALYEVRNEATQEAARKILAEMQEPSPVVEMERETTAAGVVAICVVSVGVLFLVFFVLLRVARWILSGVDLLVRRVDGWRQRRRAARVGVPSLWCRCSTPEAMRVAFLVLVGAMVVAAVALVVIAGVLVF